MPCRRPTRPRRFPFFPALLALAAAACAPVGVRTVATLDPNVPVGHIDGNRFIGRRIPMTITTGETGWQIATTYPPFPLEGLTYAARDEVSYTSGPVQRTNGWIYAFAEPFQVFFLYQLEGADPAVRHDLDAILSTFRYRNPQ